MNSLATLPFIFGMALLAGLLREATEGYADPVLVCVGGFIFSALCFLILGREEKRRSNAGTPR